MFRKLMTLAIVVSTIAALLMAESGPAAMAQSGRTSRSPSLGDRLQQLRRSLLSGGKDDHHSSHNSRPANPGHRSSSTNQRSPVHHGSTASSRPSRPATSRSNRRQPAQASRASELPHSSRRTAQSDYRRQATTTTPAPRERIADRRSASKPLAEPDTGGDSNHGKVNRSTANDNTANDNTANRNSAERPRTLPRSPASPRQGSSLSSSRPRPIAKREYPVGVPAAQAEVATPQAKTVPRHVSNDPQKEDSESLATQQSPSLTVQTAGPKRIKVGNKAAYKFRITNDGRVAAHSVRVTVQVPQWADVAGAKPTTGAADAAEATSGATDVHWEIPRLDAGATEGLLVVVLPRESRPLDLSVRWSYAPVTAQTIVQVQEPKLEMTLSGPKEVGYGKKVQYRLTVSNPGTGDAEDVVVRLLPTTAGDSETEGHSLGTLQAGTSKAVDLELIARQAGLVVIRAEASGQGGLKATVGEEVLVRRADLAVSIRGPEFQYAGTDATFEIEVTNPGNATAKNIQFAAILPPGADYLDSDSGGQLSADKAKIQWNLASLQPGGKHVVRVKYALAQVGQNRSQVTATADGDLQTSGMMITAVAAVADLKLDVRDPRVPIRVGDAASYEIHIRNRGTKAAEDVEVAAFFSDGIEPVDVEGAPHRIGRGEVAFDAIRSIAPGAEIVLKIKAVADVGGTHVFRAEVKCKTLETSLAAEETTRFYEPTSTDSGRSGASVSRSAPRTLSRAQARQIDPASNRR